MNNIININGYLAAIAYDSEINLLRGEFIGLNGGADFYAADIGSLKREAEISLQTYLDLCQEQGIEPHLAALLASDDEVDLPLERVNIQLREAEL